MDGPSIDAALILGGIHRHHHRYYYSYPYYAFGCDTACDAIRPPVPTEVGHYSDQHSTSLH